MMKYFTRLTMIWLTILLTFALVPITTLSAQDDPIPWPTNGWQTSTPEEQGMDSELLAEMMEYLQRQRGFDIHSLLIVRHGYIVTEAYFYPFMQGPLHGLASVSKSFTSTLVGIAIDQGYIESVEQPVLDYFPARSVANMDANKEAMTLEDLLTMRSGFECFHNPGEPTLSEMYASPDWVQFTLDLPMAAEPGSRWVYCTPNVYLLSAIVQEATGMSALAFAHEYLFGPLGITNVSWSSSTQAYSEGWGDLKLAPRDTAKLGYLFLHNGMWDGQQVVSSEWVSAATSSDISATYGYLWWLSPGGTYYYADGAGGQRIFVFPAQDMVVVTNGGGGGDDYGVLSRVLTSYIVPAAESDTPLPANPDGVALLQSWIEQAVMSPPPEPVPSLPALAEQISGQTIIMDSNRVGLQSGSLTFLEEAEAVLSLSFGGGFQIEWQIGLDNVYRYSTGMDGLLSIAKGGWESDSVFVFQLEEIGGHAKNQYRISFEGDQVTIEIRDLNGRDPMLTLTGQLEDRVLLQKMNAEIK